MIGKRRLFILDCAEDSSGPIGRADAAAFRGDNVKGVNRARILRGDAFVPGIKRIVQPRASVGLSWRHRPEVVVVVSQAAVSNPDGQQDQHGELHAMPEIDQGAAPKSHVAQVTTRTAPVPISPAKTMGLMTRSKPKPRENHGHRKNHQSALPPELLIELFLRFRRRLAYCVVSHFRRSQKPK